MLDSPSFWLRNTSALEQNGPSVGHCLLLTGALTGRTHGPQSLEAEVAQVDLFILPGLRASGPASGRRSVQFTLPAGEKRDSD